MKWLVVIGMLLSGYTASADLSSGGDDLANSRNHISSWAARLNGQYADLHLQPRLDIDSAETAESTLSDLDTLETVLKDKSIVPTQRLINLSCAKAFCFDGGDSGD